MKREARVIISGMVQGVSFRYFVASMAKKAGVSGWVRNTEDGKVEAVFEGDEDSVKKMVDSCRTGPPSSNVESIDVRWGAYSGKYERFTIASQ